MPDPVFSEAEAHESPGLLLWQVTAMWQRQIAAVLRPHQLTQVQFAFLASLLWLEHGGEPVTQISLARHTRLDPMMTSQVLRALATRGLVSRSPHPTDTRAKQLALTANGRELARAMVPLVERADADYFAALGEQRRAFLTALRTLAG